MTFIRPMSDHLFSVVVCPSVPVLIFIFICSFFFFFLVSRSNMTVFFQPGIFEISDEDRLHSFSESYKLGINLIKGNDKFWIWFQVLCLGTTYDFILYFLILNFFLRSGVHSSNLASLDAKLIPEHLFYLSIDYKRKFHSSSKSANRYNFYKVFPSSVVLIFLEPWIFFPFFFLWLYHDLCIFLFFVDPGFKCSWDWTNAESTCTAKTADHIPFKWVGRAEWSAEIFGCHWHAPDSSIWYPSS